jgi:hypothetical protein
MDFQQFYAGLPDKHKRILLEWLGGNDVHGNNVQRTSRDKARC